MTPVHRPFAVFVLAGGVFFGSVGPVEAQMLDDRNPDRSNETATGDDPTTEPPEFTLEGSHSIHTLTGAKTGRSMTYALYLPKGYAESDLQYPVIYFLHGAGIARRDELPADYGRWQMAFYDRAIARGLIPPVIVAMPVTRGVSLWADAKDGSTLASTQFIEEFIPHVDQTYRTIPEQKGRIIEGFSMGGNGAILFGAKHPELFSGVISIDAAIHVWDTLGDYGRADIAAETFGNDENYFQTYSPDHQVAENAASIREHGTEFILLVGELKSYNERFRAVMEAENIPLRYTDTTFKHEMGKLRMYDRDAIFSLVNKYFR